MTSSAQTALKWTGLAVAFIVAGIGLIFGFYQGLPAQQVILYTAATFALVAWAWRAFTSRWGDAARAAGVVEGVDAEGNPAQSSAKAARRAFIRKNRPVIAGLILLLLVFGICSITITGFF